MLRIDEDRLNQIETEYPGIKDTIRSIEDDCLPMCSHCGSHDTAQVLCGVIGRTINIAAATTKATLVANEPPGKYYCNSCRQFFD